MKNALRIICLFPIVSHPIIYGYDLQRTSRLCLGVIRLLSKILSLKFRSTKFATFEILLHFDYCERRCLVIKTKSQEEVFYFLRVASC